MKSSLCERDRSKFQLFCGPGLTEQHHKDSCDINLILAKYRKSGLLEHVSKFEGKYDDFCNVLDYHSALNSVIAADEMFHSLPADLRTRFDNDPGQFLSFVDNPDNFDEMQKLGLLKPEAVKPGKASDVVLKPTDGESGGTAHLPT